MEWQRTGAEGLIKTGGGNNEKENLRENEPEEKGASKREGKFVPNFSLSVLDSSTWTDVVSFINRLDSTTGGRKTCIYVSCHEGGIPLKLTNRWLTSAGANFSIKSRPIEKLANNRTSVIIPPLIRLRFVFELRRWWFVNWALYY